MATNLPPYSVLNRRVVLATVNNTNGNIIPESYKVFGPYAQGIRATKLRIGNKVVIPLTTETGEGSFFLKVHFPSTSAAVSNANLSRSLYVTFCVKRQDYDDGYRDYTQRVPEAFITALDRWIDNGRPASTSGVIRYRKLSFTAYGQQTSRVNQAVSFEIRFNYRGANVGGGVVNNPNIQNVNTPGLTVNNPNVSGPNNVSSIQADGANFSFR